jgi:MSHA biogenesis protein MshN
VEPQGSLDITEEHLSPHEEAALDRRKGLQAVAKGQLDVARDAFSRVLANEPKDHEIRERLAGLLYGDGRVPEAQQLLEEGIRLAPARADFRLMQARLALSTGNKAQALQSLSGWEPPVASNLDYYATRAALAQELSQTSLAASSYRLLAQAQPEEARWWLGLGISLDKQGRPLAALDAYRKALGLPLSAGSRHFVQQRIGQLE